MGYQGGEVASLCQAEPLQRAIHDIADKGGDRLHTLVVQYTHVDSGNLRSSWYREPTFGSRHRTVGGAPRYQVWVRSDVEYAAAVENGTGLWGPKAAKYEIKPKTKTWLSWIGPTGTRVFARRVMHPGSRGNHMMARSLNTLESEIDWLSAPILRAWERAQEAGADG